MRFLIKACAIIGLFACVAGVSGLVYFLQTGVSARPRPGAVETLVARTLRDIAIRRHALHVENPVPTSDEALAAGRAHFADHCASCHANDGSGETEMGRGLYPRAPDMRLAATQQLGDHELFYIIENGIRLTGMPAWGTDTREGEEASWRLVRFIRHLPQVTPEETTDMDAMNPKPPDEIRQQIEEEKFLAGGADTLAPPTSTHKR
jgi:mono/diheme cytochrome c family protein